MGYFALLGYSEPEGKQKVMDLRWRHFACLSFWAGRETEYNGFEEGNTLPYLSFWAKGEESQKPKFLGSSPAKK